MMLVKGPVCPELGQFEELEQRSRCHKGPRAMAERCVLSDPNRKFVPTKQPEFPELDTSPFAESKPELISQGQRKKFLFRNSERAGNFIGHPYQLCFSLLPKISI